MSYKVELIDKISLTKIKDIEVVNEPEVYEEINGSFTLDFDAHYTAKNDLTSSVLVRVDGKYFAIAKVTKSRDDSITLSVHCEHVSYELIIDFDLSEDIEFESDAQTMISECLTGTRFNLVSCMATPEKYYKTRTLDIRKRLFDIANLFGGELIFDNFDVRLVEQRGTDKGLDVVLGVNLLGVTEEKDYVEGTTAYELDMVDLSEVVGYELNFSRAEIGDTITIIDNVLGIHSNERIIAIRYNPFQRALPTLTVGDYIPDMTSYIKDTEEDEEEQETDIKDLFRQFKIGGVDMLKSASDATSDVLSYLTNKYELGVEVSAKYNTLKTELVGIVAEAASANKILSVVQTKADKDGLVVTTITPITSSNQLSSVKINDLENITLVLSDKPLAHYKANPVEAETANIKAIGVCVTFDDSENVFLEKFNVGNLSLLGAENLDCTENVRGSFDGGVAPVANAEIEIEEKLKGLLVVPKEEYKNWYLTLLRGTGVKVNGQISYSDIEIHTLPLENYTNFEVGTHEADSVVVVISNEPFESIIDGTTTDDLYYRAFGGVFITGEPLQEETDITNYFSEFRIGDVDMLSKASDEKMSVLDFFENRNHVIAGAVYEVEKPESLTGVHVSLKPEYQDKFLYLLDTYISKYGDVTGYSDSYADNVNMYGILDIKVPFRDNKKNSFTLVLMDDHIDASIGDRTLDELIIGAYGISIVVTGSEDEPGEEGVFLESGFCPLSEYMELEFENGPYKEIRSITTGFSINPQIIVNTLDDEPSMSMTMNNTFIPPFVVASGAFDMYEGGFYGIVAECPGYDGSYEGLMVDFQVICVKGDVDIPDIPAPS